MTPNELPEASAEEAARSLSREMAAAYDGYLYEPDPPAENFVRRLFGIGSLHGCDAPMADLLDLGCGTGRILADMAADMTGRAVGIDLSAASLGVARERCAPLGKRAEILLADFLDVKPADLDQFDLICNVGVQYVMPGEVRRHLLRLMGECVRPGGMVVISYYTGPESWARMPIYRMVQSKTDPGATPQARVAAARGLLRELVNVAEGNPQQTLIKAIAASLLSLKEATLFHEIFNPLFDVLHTSDLAGELRPYGLHFLNFLQASTLNGTKTSHERLAAAADLDVLVSGYRYAVFGKPKGEDAIFDIWAPDVRWRSEAIYRADLSDAETSVYDGLKGKKTVRVNSPPIDFALRQMQETPRTLREICEAASRQGPGVGLQLGDARFAESLCKLWGAGLLTPLRDA